MNTFSLTQLASADLDAVWQYIGIEQQNPDAAHAIVESLFGSFTTLAAFPYMGRAAHEVADILSGIRVFSEPHARSTTCRKTVAFRSLVCCIRGRVTRPLNSHRVYCETPQATLTPRGVFAPSQTSAQVLAQPRFVGRFLV